MPAAKKVVNLLAKKLPKSILPQSLLDAAPALPQKKVKKEKKVKRYRFRSSVNGRVVTPSFAFKHPNVTEKEFIRPVVPAPGTDYNAVDGKRVKVVAKLRGKGGKAAKYLAIHNPGTSKERVVQFTRAQVDAGKLKYVPVSKYKIATKKK